MREDLGGTYGVQVDGAAARDPSPRFTFQVSFGADPERLEELTSVVFAEMDSLRRQGPDPEVVDKVKESQRRGNETSLRQNSYWMWQLLYADRLGTDPTDIARYEALIDALTGDAIRDAAGRYLRFDNYVRVSLYPEERPSG